MPTITRVRTIQASTYVVKYATTIIAPTGSESYGFGMSGMSVSATNVKSGRGMSAKRAFTATTTSSDMTFAITETTMIVVKVGRKARSADGMAKTFLQARQRKLTAANLG
jgi:hypothetical protein